MTLSNEKRILIIGTGGREHALAWRLLQSPSKPEVYALNGNPGMEEDKVERVPGDPTDFERIRQMCIDLRINLVIVGPEQPLVDGLVDYFKKDLALRDIPVFGPSKKAAQLEGSKRFAKDFMARHNIPTARYGTFTRESMEEAVEFLSTLKPPYVLKADGLAGGKGVIIPETLEEANEALRALLDGQFGEASSTVVIEEFLHGREVSVFAICDGEDYYLLPPAKDYKRALDGDRGPNTGGMGSVSPVPYISDAFMAKVEERVIKPTLKGMREEGYPFVGFMFLGLMCTPEGEPQVIEYNVRMGDPETQVVMQRVEGEFAGMLLNAARGELGDSTMEVNDDFCVSISLTSEGYPGKYETGKEITIEKVWNGQCKLFHAGTCLEDGILSTKGGRVFSACGRGKNLQEALEKAQKVADSISFEGKTSRGDIGQDIMRYSAQ
ncbi:MAG: phosphoribosylamine--glycine ligase [Bacteroidetes bacterium]|nr:MAG: phosphoribosylamine--glycine ligase [Bacteroidota bacterium]